MAGYLDTKKLIEDTLVGRPQGTMIYPEDHQNFALSLLDYIHSVELLGASTLQGIATPTTVPVQPDGAYVSYIATVPSGQTYMFDNFHDENGNSISVTSAENTVSLLTLLWNGEYWQVQVTVVQLAVGYSDGYLFKGIAVLTPTPTDPGEPDQNVFYIATQTGTYTNFGSLVVLAGEVAILKWNGSWSKETTGIASNATVSALAENVKKIDSALTIRKYIELSETSLQQGKAVGLSGIVSDELFNLYTYAIEEGRDYHIHAFLNAGWTNRYIVCFSTDAAGNNVIGFAYRGGEASLYVPPTDSEEFYEKLNIPEGALYFHIGIRNTEFATNWLKVAYSIIQDDVFFTATSFNDNVKRIDSALTIREYVDLPETSLQLGKAVGLSSIVSDELFNLYTYAIENGKEYHIHAYLNAGWANRYIVCFSTDAAGNNIISFAYRGGTVALHVPSQTSGKFYEKLNIPEGALYFHIGIRNTEYAMNYLKVAYSIIQDDVFFDATTFNDRLTTLEDGGLSGGNSIAALYNNGNHLGKIRSIIKNIASGRGDETLNTDSSVPQPISILHFSDAHGSSVNFERVLKYFALFRSEINDIIHTGDLVSDYYESGFSQLANLAGFSSVLQVIGNHDTRKLNSEYSDVRQWSEYAGKVAYDTYIAPYIANWGDANNPITQPADAASVGKCYYYKDYAANKIRLIVIDNMVMLSTSENYDPNQITWFESVLANALQNELTVVVAMHFPNDDSVIDCPFTNYGRQPDTGDWASAQMAQFFDAVNAFKQNGGEFVCWFCGHVHTSLIGHPGTYTDQLIVAVGSTIMDGRGSFPRVGDTKTQDFFHLMGIDTYRKTLKVLQIGVEYDAYMRHRECFCYNYDTGTFIKMSE